MDYPTYREGFGPVTFVARDGTRVEVHKRADGWWGWTRRAKNGRKTGTNGQGLQRCRAIAAARQVAGPGAREVAK